MATVANSGGSCCRSKMPLPTFSIFGRLLMSMFSLSKSTFCSNIVFTLSWLLRPRPSSVVIDENGGVRSVQATSSSVSVSSCSD